MTALSWILGGIVLAYTVVYAIRTMKPIMAYKRSCKDGRMKKSTGTVVAKIEEKSKAQKGQVVTICYPRYEYEFNGEKKQIQSTVPYTNVTVGDPVEIEIDERTGDGWATKDIPLMKRNLVIRVLVIAAILSLLVVTDLLR